MDCRHFSRSFTWSLLGIRMEIFGFLCFSFRRRAGEKIIITTLWYDGSRARKIQTTYCRNWQSRGTISDFRAVSSQKTEWLYDTAFQAVRRYYFIEFVPRTLIFLFYWIYETVTFWYFFVEPCWLWHVFLPPQILARHYGIFSGTGKIFRVPHLSPAPKK